MVVRLKDLLVNDIRRLIIIIWQTTERPTRRFHERWRRSSSHGMCWPVWTATCSLSWCPRSDISQWMCRRAAPGRSLCSPRCNDCPSKRSAAAPCPRRSLCRTTLAWSPPYCPAGYEFGPWWRSQGESWNEARPQLNCEFNCLLI